MLITSLLTQLPALAPAVLAQPAADSGLLVPVGGGYADVYPGIVDALLDQAQNGQVKITVLAPTYSTNPDAISPGERETNLNDAERRRFELEEACRRAAPKTITCTAEIAPVFVRSDAEDPRNLRYFGPDVTGVFVLGGDQGVAMEVLAGTPVEAALADIYARGGVIAGTSAGGGMQSQAMIADYAPNFAAANALDYGSALLWENGTQRGLSFGVADAIFDQHFFQRGRVGRLLEAISRPDSPHIGVGIDAYTGLRVADGSLLEDVFGLYTVAVLDAETLGAARQVQYVGEERTLSLRNVLVGLLAPGSYTYDLAQRRHSLAAPLKPAPRTFDGLALPQGAGTLLLGGGSAQPGKDAVYTRLLEEVGSTKQPVLVVAVGYPNDKPAQRAADKIAKALGVPAETKIVTSKSGTPLALDRPYSAIVVTGRDQSLIDPATLAAARSAWLAGTPLLLDGAAAAIAGPVFSKHGPPAKEGDAAEIDAQRSFLQGRTVITAGLDLLPVTVEPEVLETNRWGRLFSLAYNHSDLPAFAVGSDTALVVDATGATVVGDSVVVALDLRSAVKALGDNKAYVIANGLLDVFAPGDRVEPELAMGALLADGATRWWPERVVTVQ